MTNIKEGAVYEVVWVDSGFEHGWRKNGSIPDDLPKIRSYGFITHKTDIMLEISSHLSITGDSLNPLGIPLGAILEINELKDTNERCSNSY